MFYNYSTEKFSYTWGDNLYSFEPGTVYETVITDIRGRNPLELNDVLSRFFAKHLAEHILNQNKDVAGDPLKYNLTNLEMLTERGVNPPSSVVPMPDFQSDLKVLQGPVEAKEEVKEAHVEEKKKMGRPKKAASPSPDAEFTI